MLFRSIPRIVHVNGTNQAERTGIIVGVIVGVVIVVLLIALSVIAYVRGGAVRGSFSNRKPSVRNRPVSGLLRITTPVYSCPPQPTLRPLCLWQPRRNHINRPRPNTPAPPTRCLRRARHPRKRRHHPLRRHTTRHCTRRAQGRRAALEQRKIGRAHV